MDYETKKMNAVLAVKQFMGGGDAAFLFDDLKKDIALKMIRPDSTCEEREELFMLTKAIDAINVKLQECVNEYTRIQEKHNG